MKMVTRIALANAKYHKTKNILTGVAIFLTTLLLFLVPTIGYDMVESQYAAINELYPTWHALYKNVTEETVGKVSVHHLIERYGLLCDLGYMVDEEAKISMMYFDEEGFDMYKLELLEGRLPEMENEIVVSKGVLDEISQTGKIGDVITVPYQVYRNGGLDFMQERDFVICGFIADTEASIQQRSYASFVSKALVEKEIPPEQLAYYLLFQVFADNSTTTEAIKEEVNQLASQFEIPEQSVQFNKEYLGANYVDPTYVPTIVIIMLIIVVAGVITIYSIYYVSMGERVQEFGKIKAIGATKKQLRKIVLLEGMIVAGVAIPLGLVIGTILTKFVFLGIFSQTENIMITVIRELIDNGTISLYHLWIYVLAAGVAVATVYLSLLRPMKVAAQVSEIEAMRYQDARYGKKIRKERTGYQNISIGKLTKVYLGGNKKKSFITICSMAITGLLFMIIATVLSCADPMESSKNSILGEYEISSIIESNNKEHPELEWSEVLKNNPLTEDLKEQILQIDGIQAVECFQKTYVISEAFDGSKEWVVGIPENRKEQLESGIIEGSTSYEELLSGNKVIIDRKLLFWHPDLQIGDVLNVVVEDGNGTHKRELEIVAIGDYPLSLTNYSYLLMAQEGIEKFSDNNLNRHYHIFADEKYNAKVEEKLNAIVAESGRLEMRVWLDVYEEYKAGISITSSICYAFLGILGAICIMNMVNTMIHSVHIRKKEIGMLQAVGMSDAQLLKMLQLEGLFYTIGTLLVAVGGGSLVGYPVFLWAKDNGIFNISNYHYPAEAAIIVVVVLIGVQSVLAFALGKSMKKESLIDRIRFSE